MPGAPSLQPQWCDECGRQEMVWVVSATGTETEQRVDKDIESQTGSADALVGRQMETASEESEANTLANSEDEMASYYLCTDPTCKSHIDILGDITQWKLKRAADREYSDAELNEVVDEKRREAIRDYRAVIKNVKKLSDTKVQDTTENDSSTEIEPTDTATQTDEQSQAQQANSQDERVLLQQLDPCKCGKQQKPRQTSVGETATEEQSVKNTDSMVHSLRASVAAIPFVNAEVGGEKKSGDETTNKETSTIKTIDTGTFPICPDLSCEEHLKMLGLIECWKRRRDSSHEYSDKEINEMLKEKLAQEINDDQILTENAEVVFDEMVGNSPDHGTGPELNDEQKSSPDLSDDQEPSNAGSDPATESDERTIETEASAGSVVTDALYEQLDGIEPADEDSAFQHDALDDKIDAIGTEFTRIENGVAELEADPNTNIKSDATQQQLLDQLAAMTTQDEETEAQIDQLTESISTIDPQLPQADDQLDLFAGQIADLEANDEVHTNLAESTAGPPEIQQLDSRLDAIDAEDGADEIMQRRDSLKQDVALLDQRYDRTAEKITELDPNQNTHADQTETSDASEEANEATTSEDTKDTDQNKNSETTEAADQGKETNTPNQTNDTDSSERDDGSPTDDGGDDPGGEQETDTVEESPTIEPDTEPAQVTADSSGNETDQPGSDDNESASQSEDIDTEPTVSDGDISDRLTGTRPSNSDGTGSTNSKDKDNDNRKGPGGSSL